MAHPPEPMPVEALLAHRDFLASLARRLVGNDADTDDLVQDAVLASLREPAPGTSSLEAWLGSIVRNRWRTRQHEERSRRRRGERAARPEAIDGREAWRGLELRRQVIDAVHSLPEPYLTAIYLRNYEQLSIVAVAARTNVPAQTARSRIQRGIELLRARLDRDFGSRNAWVVALGRCLLEDAEPPVILASTVGTPLGWIAGASIAATSIFLAFLVTRPWSDPGRHETIAPGSSAGRHGTDSTAIPSVARAVERALRGGMAFDDLETSEDWERLEFVVPLRYPDTPFVLAW